MKTATVEELNDSMTQKGWYIPMPIVELFRADKINKGEMLLLATVYSFVKNSKHRSCFVTNQTMAEHLRCTKSWARQTIYSLVKKGYLDSWVDKIHDSKRVARHLRCVDLHTLSPCQKNDTLGVRIPTHNKQPKLGKTSKEVSPERSAKRSGVNRSLSWNGKNYKQTIEYDDDDNNLSTDFLGAKKSKTTITSQDVELARQLWEVLFKLKRLRTDKRKAFNQFEKVKRSWSKAISQLREREGKTWTKKVIQWYVAHAADKYTPVVWSVQSFKKKFRQIEQAIDRHDKQNPQIKISKEAKQIVERLKEFNWPGTSSDQLPAVVQQSLDNFKKFRESCSDIKKDPDASAIARYVCNELAHPSEFVFQWFEEVFWRVEGWDKWDGKLQREVISVDHDRFKKLCMTTTGTWNNNPKSWLPVMEKLVNACNRD